MGRKKRAKKRGADVSEHQENNPLGSGRAIRRIHVPIVHGIGVTNHREWSQKSTEKLLSWWQATTTEKLSDIECDGCGVMRQHNHVLLNDDQCEVVLDPVLWGADVGDRTWNEAFGWFRHALFSLGLVNVAAALQSLIPSHENTKKGLARALVAGVRRCVGLIARAIAIVVLLIVGFIARILGRALEPLGRVLGLRCQWLHRIKTMIVHALSWIEVSDGGRRAIADQVWASITSVDSDERVLVGHSQGGSILAELARRGQLGRRDQLVTLGSGHALLATQRVLETKQNVGKWGCLLVFLFAAPMSLLTISLTSSTAVALRGFVVLLATIAYSTSAMLFAGLDASVSAHQTAAALSYYRKLGEVTASDTALVWMGPITFLLGLFIAVGVAVTKNWLPEIAESNAIDCPGVDLVARHDPVASAMSLLGSPHRVVRIVQTDSVFFDHIKYFENGLVLTDICRRIEAAANSTTGPSAVRTRELFEVGSLELNNALLVRRWAAFGSGVLVVIFGIPILASTVGMLTSLLVVVMALSSISIISACRRNATLNRYAERLKKKGYGPMAVLGQKRSRIRSWKWSVTALLIAGTAAGPALVFPTELQDRTQDMHRMFNLLGLNLLASPILVIGAAMVAAGFRCSRLIVAAGLTITSILLVAMPQPLNPAPGFYGAVTFGLAVAAVHRHRKLTTQALKSVEAQ
ncbi:hypothetical protein ATN38_03480 [Rhodococcus sp. FH8]|uniref:hypothetical protein n=1 Tax=Rhodococcus TaxID=1827 RepID=UPI0005AA3DF3|nr:MULTISPECIES: hypothetical protein [Rhodococcus]MBW0288001.1 hypothetical protein [Rhodococcus sp. FH8]MBW4814950.1 hypothetical protein [Rhodococcus qingshengii]MCD2133377.1 hypothetical protein [Rhodococcus qingshengii]